MADQCWKCATPVQWSAGVGTFCPNPACDVVDALDRDDTFEVRIILDAVRGAADHAAPEAAAKAWRRELAPQE